ncbi:DUF998 domain-containing protein [Paracoccus luteus]|uniref:DUF998 domain-containing protein n=1 Tax=Paracoccus luteus TaxID=2508543 RepID=UPI00107038AD|nr:DUF998 domain-containing protein [Paracoccus luteus]
MGGIDGRHSGAEQRADNDLVLSFLRVRRAIGVLGFFLPTALVLYSLTLGSGLLPTISDYYYSPMREVLVGSLCAIAVFLWSYEGYDPCPGEWLSDRMAARTAALGALAVAWAPTRPDLPLGCRLAEPPPLICTASQDAFGETVAYALHWLGAAAFFGALAAFCLVLFVRGTARTQEKAASNRIYRLCGWTIIGCMAAIAILKIGRFEAALIGLSPVFWLETLATFAFATSWLVKGDSLRPVVRAVALTDPPTPDATVPAAPPPGSGGDPLSDD